MSLGLPPQIDLPYFAYGLFMEGELCHWRIERFLSAAPVDDCVPRSLLIRDGLPLASRKDGNGSTEGSVLHFDAENRKKAYTVIADFEPEAHYLWDVSNTLATGLRVNILALRSPDKGNPVLFEGNRWSHLDDPVFKKGLLVVTEIAEQHGNETFTASRPDSFEWIRFYRLQSAYLLLWAVIERYTAFAFGPSVNPMPRIKALATHKPFCDAVRKNVCRKDEVTDTRDLQAYCLDPESPEQAAHYYYQVRNNLSHRGKGAWKDGEVVRQSLNELLVVFNEVLAN